MKQLYLLATALFCITPAMAKVVKYECPSVVMMQQAKRDVGNSNIFYVENQGVKFEVYNFNSPIVSVKNIYGQDLGDKFDLRCDYATTNDAFVFSAKAFLNGEKCRVNLASNCNDPADCPVICSPTTLNPNDTKDGFTFDKGMKESSQGKGIVVDMDIKTAD